MYRLQSEPVRIKTDALLQPELLTLTRRSWVMLAACQLVPFAYTYVPVMRTLAEQWSTNDTYSFGILVPFISGYLIWLRRHRLFSQPIVPAFIPGLVLMLISATLLMLGRVTAIVALQEVSMVVMLLALTAVNFGTRVLRLAAFPLLYLLLMLPIWEIITNPLHVPSQLLSASLAKWLLDVVGVPVYHDGISLQIANMTLEVASACSGINFLIAVIAVGLPQAYLRLNGWGPRVVALAIGIAIALLSNGVRVAIIGVLAYYQLSQALHGPGHILQGLFVSAFGFVALIASVQLLARFYPKTTEPAAGSLGRHALVDGRRGLGAGAIATVVLVALSQYSPVVPIRAASGEFVAASTMLSGEWRSGNGTVPAQLVTQSPTRATAHQFIHTATGQQVELFVGDLAEASARGLVYREMVRPAKFTESGVEIATGSAGIVHATRISAPKGKGSLEAIYWYDIDGVASPRGQYAKALTSSRLLLGAKQWPLLVVAVTEHQPTRNGSPDGLTRFAAAVAEDLARTRR